MNRRLVPVVVQRRTGRSGIRAFSARNVACESARRFELKPQLTAPGHGAARIPQSFRCLAQLREEAFSAWLDSQHRRAGRIETQLHGEDLTLFVNWRDGSRCYCFNERFR